jgi:hypothetical protein
MMSQLRQLIAADYDEGVDWGALSSEDWLAIALAYTEPITRIIRWNGLEIGIQHEVGAVRYGVPLACCYGHIRSHYSTDGKSLDCLVGMNLKSDRLFEIDQVGEDAEPKIMVGFGTKDDAIANYLYHYPEEMYGGVREIGVNYLARYRRGGTSDFKEREYRRDRKGQFSKTASTPATPTVRDQSGEMVLSNPKFKTLSNRDELKKAVRKWDAAKKIIRDANIDWAREEPERIQTNIDRVRAYLAPLDSKAPTAAIAKKRSVGEQRLEELKQDLTDATKRVAAAQKEYAKSPVKGLPRKRIEAVLAITGAITYELSSKTSTLSGVVDKDGNLQAAFSYTKKRDCVYVDYLASAPWNVIPNHANATKGAGTSAIEQAVRISQESGRRGRVRLQALPDAVPFYEKVGFTADKEQDEPTLLSMTLSSTAATTFLEKIK